MNPGKMRQRALFQAREEIDDGYGNMIGGWADRFSRWCNVRYLKGGETVMAARLEARQPVLVRIRKDDRTAQIAPDWRLLIDGREYNITEPPRPTENGGHYEFLCESGVAT